MRGLSNARAGSRCPPPRDQAGGLSMPEQGAQRPQPTHLPTAGPWRLVTRAAVRRGWLRGPCYSASIFWGHTHHVRSVKGVPIFFCSNDGTPLASRVMQEDTRGGECSDLPFSPAAWCAAPRRGTWNPHTHTHHQTNKHTHAETADVVLSFLEVAIHAILCVTVHSSRALGRIPSTHATRAPPL